MIERAPLLERLAAGPIVLDAGMGTRLIALGLSLANDDPVLWNGSRPEVVQRIHELDIAAGAEGLLTNTLGGNRFWLDRLGRAGEAVMLNHRAVALARSSAGASRYVIGSIGPTVVQAAGSVREQAEALVETGVDALLLETFRADQAVIALKELECPCPIPIFVSLFEWPDPIADWARRLENLGANGLGVNCVGVSEARRAVPRIAEATTLPILVKPSGGTPELHAEAVSELLGFGVRLIGGCCGTTEAHVAAIHRACYDSWGIRDRAGG